MRENGRAAPIWRFCVTPPPPQAISSLIHPKHGVRLTTAQKPGAHGRQRGSMKRRRAAPPRLVRQTTEACALWCSIMLAAMKSKPGRSAVSVHMTRLIRTSACGSRPSSNSRHFAAQKIISTRPPTRGRQKLRPTPTSIRPPDAKLRTLVNTLPPGRSPLVTSPVRDNRKSIAHALAIKRPTHRSVDGRRPLVECLATIVSSPFVTDSTDLSLMEDSSQRSPSHHTGTQTLLTSITARRHNA